MKKNVLRLYLDSNLLKRILGALILGAITGIVLGFFPDAVQPYVTYTKFFGDVFIRLLKMIVVPVVLFSIICGSASIEPAKLGRIGVKIIIYYLLTSALPYSSGLYLPICCVPASVFRLSVRRLQRRRSVKHLQ